MPDEVEVYSNQLGIWQFFLQDLKSPEVIYIFLAVLASTGQISTSCLCYLWAWVWSQGLIEFAMQSPGLTFSVVFPAKAKVSDLNRNPRAIFKHDQKAPCMLNLI